MVRARRADVGGDPVSAPTQLSFEDDQRALEDAERKAVQARERYAATLARLDMRHAVEVLAREHAERPRAAPCRCQRPWLDGRGGCVKCGRRLP
jgi:hypothetical protein